MKNDWILDVLSDLRNFAGRNGLPELSAKLNETALVAASEIASSEQGKIGLAHGDERVTGNYTGTDRAGRRA